MGFWETISINDLGEIITGSTPPTKKTEYYGDRYPFITPTDICTDSRTVQTERFLSHAGYKNQKNRILPPNAVCITCIGSTLGKISMTTAPSSTNQQINSVIVNHQKHDPFFVYYLLSTIRERLHSIAGGVATPIVNKSSFSNLEVSVPPLQTQQKIAAILSTYDDLIENNTRRIKILEDMAQNLYKEWFVHFRFPGHENVPMVESELGPIPNGWEIVQLGKIANLYRGRSYRSKNLMEEGEGLPFINLKNVDREGGFRPDGLKWYDGDFKETQTANSNDIVMALTDMTQERKVVARCARVPDLGHDKYVFSMDLLKVQAMDNIQEGFLYGILKYSSFPQILKEYANGTTVLHLSPKQVETGQLVLPKSELRSKYANITNLIRKQTDDLQKKNYVLQETRNILLPKLISGEIDVSNMHIDTQRLQEKSSES
ncbi:restriction endonuclease subunit S [Candidatus Poribacteria bacterium]|nr:restriction endonuclease subunit S [Candidatus Poribacteria bacterium]